MIQLYNETWEILIRLFEVTNRRQDFTPYCIIKSLHDFILSIPKKELIYDLGCGENNLKLCYNAFYNKQIIGIDRTPEADIFSFFDEDTWNKLNPVNYIIAVNSIHFASNQDQLIKNIIHVIKKLKPGGKLFFTLNDLTHLDNLQYKQNWVDLGIGSIEYFWCELPNADLLKLHIKEYLTNDHYLKPYFAGLREEFDIDQKVNKIYNSGVIIDPYYGVVRCIIKKEYND